MVGGGKNSKKLSTRVSTNKRFYIKQSVKEDYISINVRKMKLRIVRGYDIGYSGFETSDNTYNICRAESFVDYRTFKSLVLGAMTYL